MKTKTWRVIRDNKTIGYVHAKSKYEAFIKSLMEHGTIDKIKSLKIIVGGLK